MRKLARTISLESPNVSMNEALINFLQLNSVENATGKKRRGKEILSSAVVSYEIPQEEQESGPSW